MRSLAKSTPVCWKASVLVSYPTHLASSLQSKAWSLSRGALPLETLYCLSIWVVQASHLVHCGVVYHSLLSILLREAPLHPKSATFISEGHCFHWISSSLEIWAILSTLFAKKTFHDFPGFKIQYKATILSIQIVTNLISHPFSAWQRFFARFTTMWPLISLSRAIDVLHLDLLDFEVSRPFTFQFFQFFSQFFVELLQLLQWSRPSYSCQQTDGCQLLQLLRCLVSGFGKSLHPSAALSTCSNP